MWFGFNWLKTDFNGGSFKQGNKFSVYLKGGTYTNF
jgi:hypothetical protein